MKRSSWIRSLSIVSRSTEEMVVLGINEPLKSPSHFVAVAQKNKFTEKFMAFADSERIRAEKWYSINHSKMESRVIRSISHLRPADFYETLHIPME